jgi:Uma2 family endonuclease
MTTRTVHLGYDLTADEFIGLDDPEGELIGGEIRPKPMPGFEHTTLCAWLCALLIRIIGPRRVCVEQDVRLSGRDVLRPDVCVVRTSSPSLHLGALDEPPMLCIEVVSPSQRASELLAKCERYHAFGVPCCWVIDPITRRAWEYNRGSAPLEKTDALGAEDLRVWTAELFEVA